MRGTVLSLRHALDDPLLTAMQFLNDVVSSFPGAMAERLNGDRDTLLARLGQGAEGAMAITVCGQGATPVHAVGGIGVERPSVALDT
jgi:hypothetical protein